MEISRFNCGNTPVVGVLVKRSPLMKDGVTLCSSFTCAVATCTRQIKDYECMINLISNQPETIYIGEEEIMIENSNSGRGI